MVFDEEDRRALDSLVIDPAAEPSFELIKYCLVWPDERPERISNAGYELLGDLWAVRGYIHRDVPVSQWGLTGTGYLKSVWDQATLEIPNWPGFARVQLTENNRRYLEAELRAAETSDTF